MSGTGAIWGAQAVTDGADLFDQPGVAAALEAFRQALNAGLVTMGDGAMLSLMVNVITPRGQASVWEGCACAVCAGAVDDGVQALLEDFGTDDDCAQAVGTH